MIRNRNLALRLGVLAVVYGGAAAALGTGYQKVSLGLAFFLLVLCFVMTVLAWAADEQAKRLQRQRADLARQAAGWSLSAAGSSAAYLLTLFPGLTAENLEALRRGAIASVSVSDVEGQPFLITYDRDDPGFRARVLRAGRP